MRARIRAVRGQTGSGVGMWTLLAASLLLAPAAADATPVTYNFLSGSATVSATFQNQTVASGTLALSGTQVTFDSAAPSVVSFDFDSAGPTIIPMSGILAGTSITLSNVELDPGAGYLNFSVTGGPTTFNYTVGPVDVSGNAALAGSITVPTTPFAYSNPALSGQVQLGAGSITLTGITLGVINVPAQGPFSGGPVTIKADLVFNGVPEPGTAFLLATGVAMIGVTGRRRWRD